MVVGVRNDEILAQAGLLLVGLDVGLVEVDHEQRQIADELLPVGIQTSRVRVDQVPEVVLPARFVLE